MKVRLNVIIRLLSVITIILGAFFIGKSLAVYANGLNSRS